MEKRRLRRSDFQLLEHLESRILLDSDSWTDDLSSSIDFSMPDTSSFDFSPAPGPSDNGDNSSDISDNSLDNTDFFPAPATFPPGRPAHLTATALSNSSIQLAWSQPADDADGFTITREGPNGKQVIATLDSEARNFLQQNLLPGTKYIYTVTAFNQDGAASAQVAVGTLGDHLTVTQQPPSITAGTPFGFTVDLRNANNITDASASSPLQVSIASGPAGGALAGNASANPAAGIAAFSGLSLTVAGNYRLSITDGTAVTVTKSFTVSPDAASAHLVLLTDPAAVVDKGLGLRVGVEDSFGNLVTSEKSRVTLSVASGPGQFRGNLSIPVNKGVATFVGANLNAAGSYTLTVQDAHLVGGSLSFAQTVTPATTTIPTIRIAPAGYTYGHEFTLSTTLHSSPNVPFTGVATLVDTGGTVLATANVAANGATHFSLNLSAGTYTAMVQYAGDANHTADTSSNFTFKVNPAPAAVDLHASATRLPAGETLTLTAQVAAPAAVAVATPTGTLSFFDGKTLLFTVSLDDHDVASLMIASLSPGTHAITAVYSGDALYKASRSKLVRVSILRSPIVAAPGASHAPFQEII